MKKIFLIILLLITSFSLTGCSKKMSEEEIKNALEVHAEGRTFTVNKATYATDKVTINGIDMQVKDNKVTLGDYTSTSPDEVYKQITGYYDQPGALYNIYVLTKNTVWKMQKNSTDEFNSVGWENMNINKATDLILIDCEETVKEFEQTPMRYQVYALVNNELVLLD